MKEPSHKAIIMLIFLSKPSPNTLHASKWRENHWSRAKILKVC